MTFDQNIANILEALTKEGDELQEQWKLGPSR
jgi:hypothetical protein